VLDRNVSHLELGALEDREQRPVAAVDVLAELQIAILVDKGGLVGQMDCQEMRKLYVLLARAEHAADAVLGEAFTWANNVQQHFRVFHRILHPHAAMAERPLVEREQIFVRRVVLIDQEFIGEVEAHAA